MGADVAPIPIDLRAFKAEESKGTTGWPSLWVLKTIAP